MAIVITNGTYYIYYTKTGATRKVSDINLAYQFPTITEAVKGMKAAKGKTKGYYVMDSLTQHILWRWLTHEEVIELRKNKAVTDIKRDKNGKIARKTYSKDVRKVIYLKAEGRCELCGRKILLDDMTIDHVIPLAKDGADEVENLSCTCYSCNVFKGNILPADFMERITEIFMYQMEKAHCNNWIWKIIRKILLKLAVEK